MRKALCAVVLAMAAFAAEGQESLRLFRTDLYRLQSLHPRLEGSPAALEGTRIITESLEQLDLPYVVQDFREAEDDHSFGVSLPSSWPSSSMDPCVSTMTGGSWPRPTRPWA